VAEGSKDIATRRDQRLLATLPSYYSKGSPSANKGRNLDRGGNECPNPPLPGSIQEKNILLFKVYRYAYCKPKIAFRSKDLNWLAMPIKEVNKYKTI
jgi:hypothetical protein